MLQKQRRSIIITRAGRPGDYVSKTTGQIIPNKISPHNTYCQKITHWLKQLFNEPEDWNVLKSQVSKYIKDNAPEWLDKNLSEDAIAFMFLCCRLFRGRNFLKEFICWYGETSGNGKSTLKRFLEAVFRNFCFTPPLTVFTGFRAESGRATPELVPAITCRAIFIQEGSRKDGSFSDGKIKEITGDDVMYLRKFITEGENYHPLFKPIYIGNRILAMYEADEAMKSRLLIFHFASRWRANAPKYVEEQRKQRCYPLDPHFDRDINVMAPVFARMLIDLYPHAMRAGLVVTDSMRKQMDKYWKRTDIYAQYIRSNIEDVFLAGGVPDPTANLSLFSLYTDFSQWLMKCYPDALGQINMSDVQIIFELRFGPLDENKDVWVGKRLKKHGMPVAGADEDFIPPGQ